MFAQIDRVLNAFFHHFCDSIVERSRDVVVNVMGLGPKVNDDRSIMHRYLVTPNLPQKLRSDAFLAFQRDVAAAQREVDRVLKWRMDLVEALQPRMQKMNHADQLQDGDLLKTTINDVTFDSAHPLPRDVVQLAMCFCLADADKRILRAALFLTRPIMLAHVKRISVLYRVT